MPDFLESQSHLCVKQSEKSCNCAPTSRTKKNASFLGVTCETRASLLGTGHDHAPRALYPVFVDVSIRFPAYR